jgi:hypothetical protein
VRWIDKVLEVALKSSPSPLPDEEAPAAPVVSAEVPTAAVAMPGTDALPH